MTLHANRKTDQLEHTLSVLGRLNSEAGTLLDVLGGSLEQLMGLTGPIQARATALTSAHIHIADTKKLVDQLTEHLDTSRRVAPLLEGGPARGLDGFLEALQQLERSNTFLKQHQGLAAVQAALGHSQAVFDGALRACEADLLSTLAAASRAGAPSPAWLAANAGTPITGESAPELTMQLVAPPAIAKLKRMADLLLASQYFAALEAYAAQRDRAVEQLLQAATGGVPLPSAAVLQGQPAEALERAVAAWAKQLHTLALLMLSERVLCDELLPAPLSQEVFADCVGRHMRSLTSAGGDMVAKARRSPDRIFALLELHQQLVGAQASLAAAAGDGPQCAALLGELGALGEAAAGAAAALFGEYEGAVAADASKVVVADGTIHPLTAQVLSFLKRLLAYPSVGPLLFGPTSRLGQTGDGEASAMAAALMRMLMAMCQVLEGKARAYKDPSLAAVFLMNNTHYMVWSVESSPAAGLLGRDWLERQKDLVEDWGAKYHALTWMPLVAMLQAELPALSDLARLKPALKERYSKFNEAIERIAQAQAPWVIPDAPLRAAVRRVIKDDLLGPYQEFLTRYADVAFTSQMAKYVRFSAADVAAILDDDLFAGAPLPPQKLNARKEKLEAMM